MPVFQGTQVRKRQCWNRVFPLAAHPQDGTARHEHGEPGTGGQQVRHQGPDLEQMLEVVENEEQPLLAAIGLYGVEQRLRRRLSHVQRIGDEGRNEARIAGCLECDEEHTGEEIDKVGGNLEGEARLACPAGSGEREQPDALSTQERFDRIDL